MAIDDNTSYELTGYQVKDLASKIRAKADSNSLASVATSGLYSDLTGAPTIPTVYNGTLTIQQNGTTLGTFSANQDTNETINITGGGSSGTVFYQGTSGSVVTLYSDQAKTQVATAQDVADAVAAGATYISVDPAGDFASVVFCYPMPGSTGQYLFRATTGAFVMELIATSTTTFIQNNTTLQEELNAGSNISISGNTISATDTTYSDFTGATSSTAGANGLVPAPAAGDETKVLHGDGTWKDTTAKLVEMSYGESNAWAKFIAAYNAGSIVYCRASSNANPATGSQTRKAFMAYVNNATNPTNVEFQYVRSQSSKTDSQQCDQVFVYKLTNASGGTWTVESRNMGPKIVAGTGMSSTFTTGANATITLNAEPNYSTSEVDTKVKWIDGKTIYRKTIHTGTLPNNNSIQVAHGISYSSIIKVEGIAQGNSSLSYTSFSLPFSGSVSNPASYVQIWTDSTNITISTGSDRSAYDSYVTLYYTKSS